MIRFIGLLLALSCSSVADAADPAHGASCSGFAAGSSACNTNGCFVCTSGSWVDQPLYTGASSATCDSSTDGLQRYNSTSHLIEHCNTTVWTGPNKIQASTALSTCNAGNKGLLRYVSGATLWDADTVEFCNGTSWLSMGHPYCSGFSSLAMTSLINQIQATQVTSAIRQVTGGTCDPLPISITGDTSAQYRICADETCSSVVTNWTNAAGTIALDNYVQLRLTTSNTGNTQVTSNLLTDVWNTSWNAKTVDCSGWSSLGLTDLTAQAPATQVTSAIAQVTGSACAQLSVSMSGDSTAQYRVCSDSSCSSVVTNWTNASGFITLDNYIQLRVTTSSTANTTVTATLTLDLYGINWNATTEDFKYIFITSTTNNGNLKGSSSNGINGADAKCATQATAGSLPGSYKAWVASGAGTNPSSTFSQASASYRLHDASYTKVANNWTGLVSGTLLHTIDVTETGGTSSATDNVWSNASSAGARVGSTNCTNWTSSSSGVNGRVGSSSATNTSWANSNQAACNGTKQLYCVQQ